MRAVLLVIATILTLALGTTVVAFVQDNREGEPLVDSFIPVANEGTFPSLGGATEWLNSAALTPADLRGKVVLIDFWTYTCINWLRTAPYVRAWAEKYKDQGLVVIGIHTPEFPLEHDLDNVRREVVNLKVNYPVAVDNDYGVWDAFNNNYWPALYLIDAQGKIRYHHFGEGNYEQSEMTIQQLLTEAGSTDANNQLVTVNPTGLELAADWDNLRSGENYLGYDRTEGFAPLDDALVGESHVYSAPAQLFLNQWALSGDWTIDHGLVRTNQTNGRILYRFHARDVNLVMESAAAGTPARFRVLIDGQVPGGAHGTDVDAQGNGVVIEPGTYQLIRQSQPIEDRTFEIEFLDPGVEAYDFTFG